MRKRENNYRNLNNKNVVIQKDKQPLTTLILTMEYGNI